MNIKRPRLEDEDTTAEKVLAFGILGLILLFILILSGRILWEGVSKAEERRARAECSKWQEESREYPQYFITGAQKSQCDWYGMDIDASVF